MGTREQGKGKEGERKPEAEDDVGEGAHESSSTCRGGSSIALRRTQQCSLPAMSGITLRPVDSSSNHSGFGTPDLYSPALEASHHSITAKTRPQSSSSPRSTTIPPLRIHPVRPL